jgi:vancomycin resistance protein VanJ
VREYFALAPRAVIAASGLWLAVWLAAGDGIRWLGYANAMGFFWGLAALCAGLILAATGRRLFGLAGLVMGSVIIAQGTPLRVRAPEPDQKAETLRLLSASARGNNRDMTALARAVLSHQPDIAMLQEVSNEPALLAAIEAFDRRPWHHASAGGLIILSPRPVLKIDAIGGVLRARVGSGPKAVDVWNLRAPKDYADPSVNARFHAALADAIDRQHPDVVAGDFNATPWNDGYATIRQRMSSAFDQAGVGPGFTFPSSARRMGTLFAFARIDHIFLAPDWRAQEAMVGTASRGADHHPVMALVSPPTR